VDTMEPAEVRRLIEEQLAELSSEDRTLADEHAGEDAGELGHYDQHPADAATDIAEADREDALREALTARRTELEAALGRLDAGTYGVCVDCGRPIPAERLRARPEVARCIEDQAKHEAALR
jgi:DnaK suppressor protein